MKVVILGQDPYHEPGQAHGLCFSVKPQVPIPPSLVNIYKELEDDLGCYIPNNGYLEKWARQGVLMLNTVLTVRAHQANSHKDLGWEQFTDAAIRVLAEQDRPMVFVLWGKPAEKERDDPQSEASDSGIAPSEPTVCLPWIFLAAVLSPGSMPIWNRTVWSRSTGRLKIFQRTEGRYHEKSSLLRNTSILMIATIVSRVIGLLYRSPLGAAIGSEGLGYYGTASNVYVILLLISSYSIPMAVSKIISERLALKQYRNAQRVFHGALIYAATVGGLAALLAFFGGKYLLAYNQQNALPALRVLAPTIFSPRSWVFCGDIFRRTIRWFPLRCPRFWSRSPTRLSAFWQVIC